MRKILSTLAGMLLLLASFPITAVAQESGHTVEGVIFDPQGLPVIGAAILEKGTGNGTITDLDGRFALEVKKLPCDLSISCIGFKDKNLTAESAALGNLVLEEDIFALDGVVVVGYGIQKKKLITGATSQVKGEDISRLNTINPLSALQSQTPGVSITQTSGMPGEGFKVTIRGLGTTGSAGPLYIIDGVTGGDIDAINPGDIESVDVLKDAASAAIYGARAANGVILVTTKKGRVGKTEISYDGYVGVQNVYKMPDLLNAREYAMIMSEARMMDGLPDYDYAALVPAWESIEDGSWEGTDWLEAIRKKNAPMQNHTVNIVGGGKTSVYSMGLSYTSQEGILGVPVQPDYSRTSLRLNSEHTLYRKDSRDLVKIGENLNYSYSERQGIAIGDIWWNDIRSMLNTTPFLPNRDESGNYHYAIPWDSRVANPVGEMEYGRGQNASKSHMIQGNLYLTAEPLKNLQFKSSLGFTFEAHSYRSFVPVYKLSSIVFNPDSMVSQDLSVGGSLIWENTLSWKRTFNNHNFNALVGQSIEKNSMGTSVGGSNVKSIFNDFKHAYLINTPIIDATRTELYGLPWGDNQLASFFGRVNYDYAGKYLFTAVLRADGSSKFAKGHRWGVFPSVSAGWVITEEPFMKKTADWLNFVKLRASWGQNGNQDIADFQYLATIAFSGADYTFGPDKSVVSSGAFPDILANSEVTWETSEQIDLGLDARLFRDRLNLAFDWYIKSTKNWLVVAPILDSNGTGAPFVNGGDVRNTGVELSLGWNDTVGDFSYGANVNLAYNRNEVTRIANSEGIIHGPSDFLSQGTSEVYRAQVGYPIGYFYGYKTAGIFQSEEEIAQYKGAKLEGARPGDVIWVDHNGNGIIDLDDQCMIGNPHPDCNAGLYLYFAWKGVDFGLTFAGAFGGQIMKSYRSYVDMPLSNYTSDIFDRWHGEGTSNRLPRLTSGTHTNWQFNSDLLMENGDYLRIQNLTVGCDLSKLIRNFPLEKLRLYFAVQNLYTFTGYSGMDPEVGFGGDEDWVSGFDFGFYPSPRTCMFGVNIKF